MNRCISIAFLFSGMFASCMAARYPDGRDYLLSREETIPSKTNPAKPFGMLGIPQSLMPHPGECKIWIPGRPDDQQAPIQDCGSAIRTAPLGAWVINHDGNRYRVIIFGESGNTVVQEVRFYQLGE